MVFISSIIFCLIVGKIAKGDSIEVIAIIATASAVGSYISGLISDRLEKDKTFISIITCRDKENLLDLHKYLTENKIKHILMPAYGLAENEKTLTIMVFCKTKHESRLFDSFVENHSEKFLKELFN